MTQLDNLHYTIRRLWSEIAAAEADAAQWKAKAEAAEEKAGMLDAVLANKWELRSYLEGVDPDWWFS